MQASNSLTLDFDPGTGSSVSIEIDPYLEKRKSTIKNTTVVGKTFYGGTFSPLSDVTVQFIGKLLSFKSLESNWDTYGAIPPSTENIYRAIEFLYKADKNLLPIYFVAPGPNGELVAEFRRGDKEAAVYFNIDGSTELILSEASHIVLEGTLDGNYRDLLTFIND